MKLSGGVYVLRISEKLKSNHVLIVLLVLESKGLYLLKSH